MATINIIVKDFLDTSKVIRTYSNIDLTFSEDNTPSYKIPIDFIADLGLSEKMNFVGLYSKSQGLGERVAYLNLNTDSQALEYDEFGITSFKQAESGKTFVLYATYGLTNVPDLQPEIDALPGLQAVQVGPYDVKDEYGNIKRQSRYYRIVGSNHFDKLYAIQFYIQGEGSQSVLFEKGEDCLMISFVEEELEELEQGDTSLSDSEGE